MKTALTIAGSDSSGGAGIQADIKTMTMNGVFAMSALTALTAQNTTGVTGILDVDPEFLEKQLDAVFTDIFPCAVKIGMVSTSALIGVIASRLEHYGARNIVVDPVMVATSGAKLICDDAIETLKARLLPMARVITPNIPEAEELWGASIASEADMEAAARDIAHRFGCAVLCKGGHNLNDANDYLFDPQAEGAAVAVGEGAGVAAGAGAGAGAAGEGAGAGAGAGAAAGAAAGDGAGAGAAAGAAAGSGDGAGRWFMGKRINNPNTHGTGCTLSSAIAANLAKGYSLEQAVSRAKEYISGALSAMLDLGAGSGPMNHAFALPKEFTQEASACAGSSPEKSAQEASACAGASPEKSAHSANVNSNTNANANASASACAGASTQNPAREAN